MKKLTIGQRIVCFITIFAGLCLIRQGIASVNNLSPLYLITIPTRAITSNVSENHSIALPETYLSDDIFSPQCKKRKISLCFPSSSLTDIFSSLDEEVHLIEPENANLEIFDSTSSKTLKLAALVEQNLQFSFPSYDYGVFNKMENLNQSILYQFYEEELPNDIIDEKGNSQYIHENHKNIKDIKILPEKKPYYFGPQPVIAIVIDDMGISHKRTAEIYKIKAPLTASFLTYGNRIKEQMEKSVEAGQEVMLHIPMEAMTTKDIAPNVLMTTMKNSEIEKNLEHQLTQFNNIKGVNNHMGSKMTANQTKMEAVMNILKKHNLFFLDSKTSALSKAKEAAEKYHVAYAHRHVFLDNHNDKNYIMKQLFLTEKLARKNGYAIAIGHPKSQTAIALREWIQTLDTKSLKIVHLSQIVQVLNPHYLPTDKKI